MTQQIVHCTAQRRRATRRTTSGCGPSRVTQLICANININQKLCANININFTLHCKTPQSDKTYHFRVRAVNTRGHGPWSDVATVLPPPDAPEVIYIYIYIYIYI